MQPLFGSRKNIRPKIFKITSRQRLAKHTSGVAADHQRFWEVYFLNWGDPLILSVMLLSENYLQLEIIDYRQKWEVIFFIISILPTSKQDWNTVLENADWFYCIILFHIGLIWYGLWRAQCPASFLAGNCISILTSLFIIYQSCCCTDINNNDHQSKFMKCQVGLIQSYNCFSVYHFQRRGSMSMTRFNTSTINCFVLNAKIIMQEDFLWCFHAKFVDGKQIPFPTFFSAQLWSIDLFISQCTDPSLKRWSMKLLTHRQIVCGKREWFVVCFFILVVMNIHLLP